MFGLSLQIGNVVSIVSQIVRAGLKLFLPFSSSQQLGEELVINGDFATDSNWNKGTGWTISNGSANGLNATGDLQQASVIESGKYYEVTFTISNYVAGSVRVELPSNSAAGITRSANGTYTERILSVGTIVQFDGRTSFTGSIDNVSVKEVAQFSPDESNNNNNAKLLTGNCLDFDGTNDYLDVSGFTMSGSNATFAFWINSNDTLGRMIDINPNRFIISFDSNQLSVYDLATTSFKNFGTISTDAWNRCVIVLSGTSAKCYVNGVQLGDEKTITALNISSADDAIIGASYTHNASFFDGEMSDFQIWNSAWSATDIANDYAKPNEVVSSVPTENLVGYWAMTEGNGDIAYDSSSLLSAEKVSNGVFELGSEEVINGDFEIGSELIVNGDFATDSNWSKDVGWSISGGVASSDGSQTGLSYLNQSGAIVSGKTYKATFEIKAISAGEVRIFVGGVQNNSPRTTTGIYTEHMTAGSTAFWIRASSNFEGSIDNVSVKEVFPNWTIAGTDATHFVQSASGGGARYFSGATSPVLTLRQDALTSGKSYQVSCNVAYTGSGKVRGSIGGVNQTPFEEGANTRAANAGSTIFQFLRNDINVDAVITNLSIKEITNWTVVGNISIINSQANFTGGADSYLIQTTLLVVGKIYKISVDYIDVTVPNNVGYFGTNGSSGTNNTSLAGLTGSGTKTAFIKAASTTLIFRSTNGGFVGTIANISVKEVTPADNGAIINGTSWLTAQSTIPQLGMMDWSKGTNLMTNSDGFNGSPWTGANVTVTTGEIAPDGTPTAMKFVNGSTDGYRQMAGIAVGTNVRSIYARTVSGTGTVQLLTHNSNSGNLFTLTTEWQRFNAQVNSSTGQGSFYAVDFRGSSTTLDEVVVWGAQVDNGTTVGNFRATNGTAVTNAILPPYPAYPTTDVLGNLLRLKLNSINLTGTSVAQVVDSASINPSVITIQCWVFSNTENDKGLVAKWASGKLDYMLLKRTNNFQFYITASGLLSGPIPTTGWVHITATYDGATRKIFINGELSTSDSFSTAIPNSPNNLEIGRYFENNDKIYSERIDDVKLYDRVLSLDEILQNYRAGLSAHPGLDELNADAFKLRVPADGGVFESYVCLKEQLTTLNDI